MHLMNFIRNSFQPKVGMKELILKIKMNILLRRFFMFLQYPDGNGFKGGVNYPIGKDVDDAMNAIEKDNPSLRGVFPKVYAQEKLDKQV